MQKDILIVGAGPTGLVTACNLLRHNITVRVIDMRVEESSDSKALSINSSSLKLFHDLGIAEEVVKSAQRVDDIYVHWQGKRLSHVDFGKLKTSYNYLLTQPQPKTEESLKQQFLQLGGTIERGVEFVDLNQHEHSVTVTTKGPEQQLVQSRHHFVIGCDGGKSRVREALNLGFEGVNYDMYFILADVVVDWPGDKSKIHYFVEESGFLILIPLTENYHRIVCKVEGTYDGSKTPTMDDFRYYIDLYGPDNLTISDPIWISSAPFYNRLVTSNHQGRVFLAGDASHLFSPIGGLGMNTGIQDACNIAWKVAYYLKGYANHKLLDSYQVERHGMAAQLVKHTDNSTRLIARLDKDEQGPLKQLLPKSSNRTFLRETFPLQTSGISQLYELGEFCRDDRSYHESSPHSMVKAGALAPYADGFESSVGHSNMDDLLTGTHLSLLIFVDDIADPELLNELQRRVLNRYLPFLCAFVVSRDRIPECIQANLSWDWIYDCEQSLAEHFSARPGDLFLIRPDNYIAYSGQLNRQHRLEEYMGQLYYDDHHKIHSIFDSEATPNQEPQHQTLADMELW